MSERRTESLGELPESVRYRRLLEGDAAAAIRVSQGLSTAGDLAGNAVGKLRKARRDAKQRKRVQAEIESGRIQDLS